MTRLPTAEWCVNMARSYDFDEAQYRAEDRSLLAEQCRKTAEALRIAARVLNEEAELQLANEMHAVIWGGHEPSGWKSFIGEARIALDYLKGEVS